MRASVVIASWNAGELLAGCLDSLAPLVEQGEIEVIVVDDGSTDATPELIAARAAIVRSLRNERSAGYCAAINRGAELARAERLLVCNSDIRFEPGAVTALLEALDRPGIGLAMPRYHRPDGTLQPGCSRFPDLIGALVLALGIHHLLPDRLRATLAPTHWSHSHSRDVDVAMGAVVAIDVTLWRELGGYWPLMYGSETDLAWRAGERGLKTRFAAEAGVMHAGNYSNRQRWSEPVRAARVAGSEIAFLEAHYRPARRVLLRLITGSSFVARSLILRALGRRDRAAEYAAMARVYAGWLDR